MQLTDPKASRALAQLATLAHLFTLKGREEEAEVVRLTGYAVELGDHVRARCAEPVTWVPGGPAQRRPGS